MTDEEWAKVIAELIAHNRIVDNKIEFLVKQQANLVAQQAKTEANLQALAEQAEADRKVMRAGFAEMRAGFGEMREGFSALISFSESIADYVRQIAQAQIAANRRIDALEDRERGQQ